MESRKAKKIGRPRKPDAKRHVFAFRFDDVQMSVIDWMFSEFAQEGETKSEIVARLFTSFLAANLAEKYLAEKARVQGVVLTLQYRQEHRKEANAELKAEIKTQTQQAAIGNRREFVPASIPRPILRPVPYPDDEGIPIPDDVISSEEIKSAKNTLPDIEGILIP